MKPIVIIDFNRTVYNPDEKALFFGVPDTLSDLRNLGYKIILLTQTRMAERKKIVFDTGICEMVDEVFFVPLKRPDHFLFCIDDGVDVSCCVSIGDYIKTDIAYANIIGMKTIRIAGGKFSLCVPICDEEVPDYTVTNFVDVEKIILGFC